MLLQVEPFRTTDMAFHVYVVDEVDSSRIIVGMIFADGTGRYRAEGSGTWYSSKLGAAKAALRNETDTAELLECGR